MPGQTVWLIAQSDGGPDDIKVVEVLAPGARGCQDIQPASVIQCELTLLEGAVKNLSSIDISVRVIFSSGAEQKVSTHINIGATRAIVALWSNPSANSLVFDFVGQEINLDVFGAAADGVQQDLREESMGTVYSVSNIGILIPLGDGKFLSRGVGEAIISVRNNFIAMDVPVVVLDTKKKKH